jgi:ethanolamine utilization microcompartment shell protein EutL
MDGENGEEENFGGNDGFEGEEQEEINEGEKTNDVKNPVHKICKKVAQKATVTAANNTSNLTIEVKAVNGTSSNLSHLLKLSSFYLAVIAVLTLN